MYKKQSGISIIELLVAVGIILILSAVIVMYTDPVARRQQARDNKRLSDISLLDRCINEYLLDNSAYPDTQNTIRYSNVFPGGAISLDNSTSGWISANLSGYTSYLPVDPLNEGQHVYSYIHNGTGYELNAVLENLTQYSLDDGGDDLNAYEVGNNLFLISP